MARMISKTNYIAGRQCPKLLWNRLRAKGSLPKIDEATKFIFGRGHRIGELAQRLWPEGELIEYEGGPFAMASRTRALLPRRIPIFEAAFLEDGAYCQVDILEPVEGGKWDIIEVKSSTSAKPVHAHDLALQRHVLRHAGIEIRHCWLMHIDREYRRGEEVDPAALFGRVQMDARVNAVQAEVSGRLREFESVLEGPEPEVAIGSHCSSPYACILKERCWANEPKHAVHELHRLGSKAFDLPQKLIVDVDPTKLNAKQRIQQQSVREATPVVDIQALEKFLDRLEWPLCFLDFETVTDAIPIWPGSGPWQPIPFQVSAHIQKEAQGELEHLEFLAAAGPDPRASVVDFLLSLPVTGNWVAWHASFEKLRLQELIEAFPAHSAALEHARNRMIDLEDPFREFLLYHPEQRGRTSIKKVLPAWVSRGYEDLQISDGNAAGRAFHQLMEGDLNPMEAEFLRQDLLAYCGRDTEGLVWLLAQLQKLTGRTPSE